MRQEGYYWVRQDEGWKIDMWHPDTQEFECHGSSLDESWFDEIDERRIERLPVYFYIDISKYSEKELKIIIDNIVDHKGPIVLKNLEKLKNP